MSVDKDHPDTMLGNSYRSHVSPTFSSLFNFDIPPSYQGLTCSLVFLFPLRASLQTSNFTFFGSGGIDVAELKAPATAKTRYSTVPAFVSSIGIIKDLEAGNSYEIASGACAAGARIGYGVSATGNLDLEYFQDYNPAPIGLYITAC